MFGLNLELSGTSLGNFESIRSEEIFEQSSEFNDDALTKIRTARSGFLDAESLLTQAIMFMQPDAYKRFSHFYENQVQQNDRYGCHCQMKDLISQDYIDYQYEGGERKQHPYSGMPVDDLDRACHNHRECLRCAKMELNCANDGISEHYLDYTLNRIGMCNDTPGTCQRAYCECAQQFIEDLNSNAMFRYEPQRFSKRIAAFDANHQTCTRIPDYPQSGGDDSSLAGRREPTKKEKRNIGCCSKSKNGDAPWRLYNTDRFQCCEDGSVATSC